MDLGSESSHSVCGLETDREGDSMPQEDRALVRVSRSLMNGLMASGSDMHVLLTGDLGYSKFKEPFILGHECAGMIAKGDSSSSTRSNADVQWGLV